MIYYFVRVPELPPEASHQSRSVEIVRYLTPERGALVPGTPIALVRNWWADIELRSLTVGTLSKRFFDSPVMKTHVRIGEPIAIVNCEPDDRPAGEATCTATGVLAHRVKPKAGPRGA